VEHLFNKVHLGRSPASARDVSPLVRVDRTNVEEYAKNWEKWLPK
jgi:ribose transport system substrate-binding protein